MAEPTQAEADAFQLQAMGVDPAHFPPANTDAPAIGGGSAPGATLTCTMGNWENEPTSYAYSWRAGNANLGGTGETYVITEDDVGREICCLVTASNAYGSTMGAPSNKVTVAAAGATRQVPREEHHEARPSAPAHRR